MLLAEFKELLDDFTSLAAECGRTIKAYEGDSPKFFQRLPAEQQMAVFKRFETYYQVCAEHVMNGHDISDDQQLLWRMIKKLGLRPSSRLFAEIKDGDVIEIYDTQEFVQIFRNFRFYEVCSYTLDDILARPWYELYHRDQAASDQIMATAMRTASARDTELLWYDVGIHQLDEIDSATRISCLIDSRFIGPLVNGSGETRAGVNVVRPVAINRANAR